MACPYFYPTARLGKSFWAIPPRCPLGDAYQGECRSACATAQPDETILRQYCNFGYGRGHCGSFPGDAEADAVRFHIAGEFGQSIRLQYVLEKDCWPILYGTADFSMATQEFIAGPTDEILRRQAAVFIESYCRRKAQ